MPTLTGIFPERVEFVPRYRSDRTPVGVVASRPVYPVGRERRSAWRLFWSDAPGAERSSVVAMMDLVKGSGSFDYTPPGGSAGTYRFIGGSFTVRQRAPGAYSMQFEIEEV